MAWFVGWSLILEYPWSARRWRWAGRPTPRACSCMGRLPRVPAGRSARDPGRRHGGIINLPAVIITAAVAGLLALGTRESATVNVVLVVDQASSALAVFVALCPAGSSTPATSPHSCPSGFAAHTLEGAGPMAMQDRGDGGGRPSSSSPSTASTPVSTAAEETKNPKRDLTIGIVGSMLVCTPIYMVVAAVAIGAVAGRGVRQERGAPGLHPARPEPAEDGRSWWPWPP